MAVERVEAWVTGVAVGFTGANGYYSCRRLLEPACPRTPRHEYAPRSQERRPQGDVAAAEDHQPVRDVEGASPDRRRRLQAAACRGTRRRPGHGLSRADAVRAGRPPDPPSLRVGQGRVRAERRQAPRPSRLHAVRTRRGVLRRGDREAAAQDRARTRLRDQRARALPLRRVHQAALPVQEGAGDCVSRRARTNARRPGRAPGPRPRAG